MAWRPRGRLQQAQRLLLQHWHTSVEAQQGAADLAQLQHCRARHSLADLRQRLVLQLHNSSLPFLEGGLVKGRVTGVDRQTVLIDAGLPRHVTMFKNELTLDRVAETTAPLDRNGPHDLRVGDVINFLLQHIESPFGEPQLSLERPLLAATAEQVVNELEWALRRGNVVQGRVLNPLSAGYAIGFGGFVAFCPSLRGTWELQQSAGLLKDFRVIRVQRKPLSVTVVPAPAYEMAGTPRAPLDVRQRMAQQQSKLQEATRLVDATAGELPKRTAQT